MSASRSATAEWRSFWFLPCAAALGYATSVLHVYSIGPFIGPLQQEFGWSRAQISAGITVSSVLSAILCIPVGILVDRIGPRFVALVGVLLMSVAFALLSTATGQKANWLMLWSLVAVGTFGVQSTVWTSAVASRFEASRGLAFAITLSGGAGAAAFFPVFATWSIGLYGWRTAFVAMAGMWSTVVFVVLFLVFRGAQDQGRNSRAARSKAASIASGLSFAEGLRSPVLYKLLIASGLFSFTTIGVVVHFVPILKDNGAEPLAAAGIASIIGIFSIIGRVGTGMLLDRFPANRVGAVAFLIPLVACALLLMDGANPTSQSAAAAVFGLTLGSEVDVIAFLAARHFGLKNFGALYGAMVMALSLGTAFGPLAAGAVFDRYDSYAPFLMLTTVLMTVSAIILLSVGAKPPKTAAFVAADAGAAALDSHH